jgi:hypothetical protein
VLTQQHLLLMQTAQNRLLLLLLSRRLLLGGSWGLRVRREVQQQEGRRGGKGHCGAGCVSAVLLPLSGSE